MLKKSFKSQIGGNKPSNHTYSFLLKEGTLVMGEIDETLMQLHEAKIRGCKSIIVEEIEYESLIVANNDEIIEQKFKKTGPVLLDLYNVIKIKEMK